MTHTEIEPERGPAATTSEGLGRELQEARDGVVITDVEGRVLMANPAACSIIGRTAPSMTGERLDALLLSRRPGASEALRVPWSRPEELRGWRGGFRFRRGGGVEDGVGECSVTALGGDVGEAAGYLVVLRDVTGRWRRDAAASNLEALERSFSRLRHELGNPLNAVKGTLRLLSRGTSRYGEERVQSYLERALKEIEGIQRYIDRLKHLSVVEDLRPQPLELQAFVDRHARSLRAEAEGAEVSLSSRVEPEGAVVEVDPRALQRALWEVTLNAVEACAGRPRREVELLLVKEGGWLLCQVRDTGGGLSAEAQERLFEPLWSGKPGHAGMGLLVALKLVGALGGTLEVRGDEGEGAMVTLKIPEGVR